MKPPLTTLAVLALLGRIAELEDRCQMLNSARVARFDAAEGLRDELREADERIADLEGMNSAYLKWHEDVVRPSLADREEAREAVKRLAEALEDAWREGYSDGIGDGHPLSSGGHRWKDSEAAQALANPVVQRIVEGG